MPVTLFCPTCRQHLPVDAAPPAGTAVQCYLCGAGFVVQGQSPQMPTPQPGYGMPFPQPAPLANQPASFGAPSYPGYAPNWQAPTPLPQYPSAAPAYAPSKPSPDSSSVITWTAILGGAAIGMILFGFAIYALTSGSRSSVVADAPAPAASNVPSPAAPVVASTPPPVVSQPAAPPAVTPASQASTAFSSSPPTTLTPPNSELTYKFEPGMHYRYAVRLDGNVSGQKVDFSGQVEYTGAQLDTTILTKLIGDKGPQEGSGTAFVVHSDGVLITCDHVTRGATKIVVHLNKQEYPARVIATDKKRDLAILRIEARGLTAVPLGNSDAVQLAEEVRAVGFPLSDVLGTSIKITRGTISGIVEKKEKLLQIDASINPGNSGGPLFNSKGEVLGVTSSGLVGESISNVGFAVPANDVARLMQTKGLTTNGRASATNLEGTELIRQVAPAVAFVRVTQSTEVAQSCLLDFTGSLNPISGSSGTAKSGRGQALLGRQGGVITSTGNEPFPFMLGSFADMVIDKLPTLDETAWDTRELIPITLTRPAQNAPSNPFSGGFGGRFGPRSRFAPTPAPAQKTEIVIPAVETTSYEMGARNGDVVVLNKKYELGTLGEKDERLLELKGEGTVSFDTRRGLPVACKMTLTYKISTDKTNVQIPLNFSYELTKVLTPAEFQQEQPVVAAKPSPALNTAVAATSTPASSPVTPKMTTTPDFGSGAAGKSSRSKSSASSTPSSGFGTGGAVDKPELAKRRPQSAARRNGKPTRFPENSQPVTETTRLVVGQKIWALWGGTWYPGSVVALKGNLVHVTYDGWNSHFDETKSRDLVLLDLKDGSLAEDVDAEPMRTWTDISGKFTVEARYLSYDDGKVTLRKADGSETQLALAKLCSADQAYVRGKLKK